MLLLFVFKPDGCDGQYSGGGYPGGGSDPGGGYPGGSDPGGGVPGGDPPGYPGGDPPDPPGGEPDGEPGGYPPDPPGGDPGGEPGGYPADSWETSCVAHCDFASGCPAGCDTSSCSEPEKSTWDLYFAYNCSPPGGAEMPCWPHCATCDGLGQNDCTSCHAGYEVTDDDDSDGAGSCTVVGAGVVPSADAAAGDAASSSSTANATEYRALGTCAGTSLPDFAAARVLALPLATLLACSAMFSQPCPLQCLPGFNGEASLQCADIGADGYGDWVIQGQCSADCYNTMPNSPSVCEGVFGSKCTYVCDPGYQPQGTHVCSAGGNYLGGSCISCGTCPAGTYSLDTCAIDTAADDGDKCLPCDGALQPGCEEGSLQCTSATNATCSACAIGYFSLPSVPLGARQCEPCAAMAGCEQVSCSDEFDAVCVDCESGRFLNSGGFLNAYERARDAALALAVNAVNQLKAVEQVAASDPLIDECVEPRAARH